MTPQQLPTPKEWNRQALGKANRQSKLKQCHSPLQHVGLPPSSGNCRNSRAVLNLLVKCALKLDWSSPASSSPASRTFGDARAKIWPRMVWANTRHACNHMVGCIVHHVFVLGRVAPRGSRKTTDRAWVILATASDRSAQHPAQKWRKWEERQSPLAMLSKRLRFHIKRSCSTTSPSLRPRVRKGRSKVRSRRDRACLRGPLGTELHCT